MKTTTLPPIRTLDQLQRHDSGPGEFRRALALALDKIKMSGFPPHSVESVREARVATARAKALIPIMVADLDAALVLLDQRTAQYEAKRAERKAAAEQERRAKAAAEAERLQLEAAERAAAQARAREVAAILDPLCGTEPPPEIRRLLDDRRDGDARRHVAHLIAETRPAVRRLAAVLGCADDRGAVLSALARLVSSPMDAYGQSAVRTGRELVAGEAADWQIDGAVDRLREIVIQNARTAAIEAAKRGAEGAVS